MKVITGKLPTSVASYVENNDFTGCFARGSEIDVKISQDGGPMTWFYAIPIGGNKWEVVDVDDTGDIMPFVEKGDIATTIQIAGLLSSSAIFSWNPIGRIKRSVKKVAKRVGRFFSDKWSDEDFRKWLEKQYGESVNVIASQEIDKQGQEKFEGRWYAVEYETSYGYTVAHLNVNGNKVESLGDWTYDNKESADEDFNALKGGEEPNAASEGEKDFYEEEAPKPEKHEYTEEEMAEWAENMSEGESSDDDVVEGKVTSQEEEEKTAEEEPETAEEGSETVEEEPEAEIVRGQISSSHSEVYWEGYEAWPDRNNPYEDNPEHDVWERGWDFRREVQRNIGC